MNLYSWEFTDYAVKLVAKDVSEFTPRLIAKGVEKNSDHVKIIIHGLERTMIDGRIKKDTTQDAIISFMIYELVKSLDDKIDSEFVMSEADKFISKMRQKCEK